MYICSAQSGNLHNLQIRLLNTRSCQSAILIAQTVEPQATTNPSLILHYGNAMVQRNECCMCI